MLSNKLLVLLLLVVVKWETTSAMKPVDPKADLNAAPALKPIADGTRPVDLTTPKSECVRMWLCN
jgi:hypothetical protein